MQFPDDATEHILSELSTQGFVFWLKGDKPFESDKFHFFIVLNRNPKCNGFLLLVNGTSQIHRRENVLSRQNINIAATTVRLHPGDYPFVTKETIIDCNSISTFEIDELSFVQSEIRFLSDQMSQEDVAKLIEAVKNSPNIAEAYKELL